jgi:hypothetical protein
MLFITSTAWAQDKGGRWQFEDNGFDTAEWDNLEDPGVLQADATYHTGDAAEGNSFLFLDTLSTNDFFKINDSEDLDFTDEDIGISMWIYPVVINDVHYLINKGDQFPEPKTTNYSLRISLNERLEFLIRDSNNMAQKVTSSFTVPVNQWTFIAVYYDYDASKVYLWNSAILTPIDTLDFNQSFFANDDPLSIGSWYRSDPENPSIKDFNGRIDDVRISGSLENIIPLTSGIEQIKRPSGFHLKQNYPNPFNPKTIINYELPMTNEVDLSIYNLLGQKVATLVSGIQSAGRHKAEWDATGFASGVYYYQLQADAGFTDTKKLILLK